MSGRDPGDPGKDALRLLKVRERSRRELESRLLRKGHVAREVKRLLDRFEADGLIDDERFARLFVEDRLRLRPRSYRYMDRELAARGVPVRIREKVLGEAQEKLPEAELARSLAARQWNRLSDRGDERGSLLLRWLCNRGFAHAVAKQAVDRVARRERAGPSESDIGPVGESSEEDVQR